ncbi:alpha/beta hydrolase [Microbacterium sp. W1N]|uniref:esterase/lipase family protein n=1 Tax=Microbacterium festucae TaxID=2977531 RepID=UPI0021C071FC|nr:alpha/beta hydrolase [Microbacterium festucae]MCT9819575.1 alpha/beta hydrolase [Microbacterium festucae]
MRAFVDRTRPDAFLGGTGAPIVVIPGIFETWKFLQPLAAAAHARGHPVHVIDALRRNRRSVTDTAAQVSAYLVAHDLTDVVIAAHSKGGLVGKQVMLGPEGHRVRAMLAVATPFGGSRYARLMLARSLRIFSPRDATIVALGRESAVNGRIVSLYARFDPHIPEGSELAGATNIRLDTGGHFRILAEPRVIAELLVLAARAGGG